MAKKIKKSTKVRLLKLAGQTRERLQKLFQLVQTLDYVFIMPEEYNNGDDIIYEYPRIYRVDKYSIYEEFVVLEIHKGVLKLGGLYDAYGKEIEGQFTELTDAALLAIADIIGEDK